MKRLTFKALYDRYQDQQVVLKATQYAKWTLPQLMAEFTQLASGQTVVLERDFQEVGALLVNNLGAKLAGLLFPSSRPFYRIEPSPEVTKLAKNKGVKDSDFQSGLSRMEKESCQQLPLNGGYEQIVQAIKHLIVTGNVLLYRDTAAKKMLAYGVQQYAVRRDGRGNLLQCILREYTDFEALTPDIQAAVRARSPGRYVDNGSDLRVELYTSVKRDFTTINGKRTDRVIYRIEQEIDGIPVGTPGSYPEHLCPWQAVCWSLIPGENYGRGLVEDYAGGFAKLSDQSHAATLYSVETMKVVNIVQPGLGADIDELNDAECGEYVQGDPEAVKAHETGDGRKLEQMEASIEVTFSRLARAFMYKGSTRDAERVTAFELKQDALEAETTLGGVYSSLASSMQIPLAHILLTEIEPGALEGVIDGRLKLNIAAGLSALGRAADVQSIAQAAQDAAAIIPVLTQVDNRVDPQKVFDIIMAGASVDTSAFFKSEERLAEDAAALQQQQLGEQQIATSTTLQDQANQLNAIGA